MVWKGVFKISHNKLFITGIICVLVMFISGIYAYTNTSIVSVKNDINTGAVNIKLQEYIVSNNGTETVYNEDNQSVLPGQVISLVPRISNLGDDCYIRAKVSYINSNNSAVSLAEDNINSLSNEWIKHGDYWYYTSVVNSGENVDLFKNVAIPEDISEESQGETLELNIIAEAVQSKNFNPDFSSESPWSEISVEKAIEGSYQADKVQSNSGISIEYKNNANLYIDVPEDFLGKLNHIMPGDLISQVITINNTTSKETEYFVSTESNSDASEKDIDLLKKLQLNIIDDGKVLYTGSMYDLDSCSLGKYQSKESSEIEFVVTVPSELGNEYTTLKTGMNWNFFVGVEQDKPNIVEPEPEKPTPTEPKPEEPEPAPTEPKPEQGKPAPEIPKNESPQTGDTKFRVAIFIFFTATIVLILVLFLERKLRQKEK